MAEITANGERVVRRGSTLSNAFAFFALVLAVVALLVAFSAQTKATDTQNQLKTANDKIVRLTTRLDDAAGTGGTANTSAGVGPNAQQPVSGTNTVPNGGGQ